MTEPTPTAIHHVTLNVHDPHQSEQWYRRVLQCSRMTEYETP